MELKLTKTEKYNLKPYGHFIIKWKTKQNHLLDIIPLNELEIMYNTSMPLTNKQDNEVVKLMKKHKTDILVNDNGEFYTRMGSGLMRINHHKLTMYSYNNNFKIIVDSQY